MFKKGVTVGTHMRLGGKDTKKLRQQVAKAFPSLSQDDYERLVPPKSIIVQSKLSNRALVFSVEGGNPLFFDPNGHADRLFPTIYALALVPALLPTIYTHSEVSPKVLGGADLFLQGVLTPVNGLEPFLAGSPRSLAVPGNPVPFAVGTMAVSLTEAQRDGMKGRGLALLHAYGDLLWHMGDKLPPNQGFTTNRVFPFSCQEEDVDADRKRALEGRLEGDGGCGSNRHATDESQGAAESSVSADQAALQGVAALDINAATTSSEQVHVGTSSGTDDGSRGGSGDVASSSVATNDGNAVASVSLDELLEAAAIGGLKSVKNADLPMMTSDFYTKYMQPLKPSGVTFDFKQSRYKKLSKLLDALEKQKLLTQKCIRKQDHISSINRAAPRIASWQGMPGSSSDDSADNHNHHASASGRSQQQQQQRASASFSVEYLFRAPSSLRPVFGAAGADKERLYTREEAAQALRAYCVTQKLCQSSDDGAPGTKLDHVLASSLWGKKQGPAEGEEILFDALLSRFVDKLQAWHRMKRGDVEVTRRGALMPVRIVAERRHGRNVTAVSHVEAFGYSADELAATFQRRFQTSCSVSKLPGKAEQDCEIMIQGDLLKQAVAWFAEQGIEGTCIDTTNKLKK